jgi:hypothetical protein
MSGPAVAFQTTRGFPAVHARQAQIHQNHVGHAIGAVGDGLGTVSGLDDVEARKRQLLRIKTPQIRLIFDQQHQRPVASRVRRVVPRVSVITEDYPTRFQAEPVGFPP